MAKTGWTPPLEIPREQVLKDSDEVLGMPSIAITETEDVFRIHEMGLDWDMGVRLYQPADAKKVPTGADGKKIGAFLLHGGEDDWRQLDQMARTMAGKFGYKVMVGTFPGRLYLQDPSRNWPGDTIHPDGSVRTPIWKKDEFVGRDEYDVITDDSMRWRYGMRTVARAKPDTPFYYRMAAWPVAMEMGFIEAARRHFPVGEFSVYGQGHSTGGPMVSMLSQRIPNFAGALAAEHSAYGIVNWEKTNWRSKTKGGNAFDQAAADNEGQRVDPFNELYIRTWRDKARYAGPEAMAKEGANALMRLPSLMEEIFNAWNAQTMRPRFKCEYIVTHCVDASLKAAAEVTARRLKMNKDETAALLARYHGYPRPLGGKDVKPVPPYLFGLALNSRDHTLENYQAVTLPMFAAFRPPAKATVTRFGAGVHGIWKAEDGLPQGIEPAVIKSWNDAIMNGFFVV